MNNVVFKFSQIGKWVRARERERERERALYILLGGNILLFHFFSSLDDCTISRGMYWQYYLSEDENTNISSAKI